LLIHLENSKATVCMSKILLFKTEEEKLREIFDDCGEIVSVRLAVHKDSGKRTGYGWIDFKTEEGRKEAKKKNRVKVDGRQLLLSLAESHKL